MTALQTSLLNELEPVVAVNLDRHLSLAKDWQPQDYVPWSRGRDFAFLGGTDWQPEDSPLDVVAQTAMIVNLLTEDNLPSYHREIATRFGRDGAWGQWVGRWTAEEGRHAIAIRDYLVVTPCHSLAFPPPSEQKNADQPGANTRAFWGLTACRNE